MGGSRGDDREEGSRREGGGRRRGKRNEIAVVLKICTLTGTKKTTGKTNRLQTLYILTVRVPRQ